MENVEFCTWAAIASDGSRVAPSQHQLSFLIKLLTHVEDNLAVEARTLCATIVALLQYLGL